VGISIPRKILKKTGVKFSGWLWAINMLKDNSARMDFNKFMQGSAMMRWRNLPQVFDFLPLKRQDRKRKIAIGLRH
jgi:hypothetical protein